jgi:hypothetical protein
MKKHTTHSHHIIPQHAGGTDDPSNLIELTVEEHAEAHRQLYEQHGLIEDMLAWKGLAGLATKAEIHYELLSKARMGENNPMWGKPAPNRGVKRPGVGGRKKGTKWSDEERAIKMKQRESAEYKSMMREKVWGNTERNEAIGSATRGTTGSSASGKKWYTDGKVEQYYEEGTQPKGFSLGRLRNK